MLPGTSLWLSLSVWVQPPSATPSDPLWGAHEACSLTRDEGAGMGIPPDRTGGRLRMHGRRPLALGRVHRHASAPWRRAFLGYIGHQRCGLIPHRPLCAAGGASPSAPRAPRGALPGHERLLRRVHHVLDLQYGSPPSPCETVTPTAARRRDPSPTRKELEEPHRGYRCGPEGQDRSAVVGDLSEERASEIS